MEGPAHYDQADKTVVSGVASSGCCEGCDSTLAIRSERGPAAWLWAKEHQLGTGTEAQEPGIPGATGRSLHPYFFL